MGDSNRIARKDRNGGERTISEKLPTSSTATVQERSVSNIPKVLKKCHYLNIRGLYPKSNQSKIKLLEDLLKESESMFISITEAQLNDTIITSEVNIKNYELYMSNRAFRKGGGVALYVNDSYGSCKQGQFSNGACECLVVKIEKLKTVVITCYRPPDCFLSELVQLIEFMENELSKVNQNFYTIIINGDFNFPFVRWSDGENTEDIGSYTIGSGKTLDQKTQAEKFLDFTDKWFLTQVINQPTRYENILDLFFVSTCEYIKSVDINDTNLLITN